MKKISALALVLALVSGMTAAEEIPQNAAGAGFTTSPAEILRAVQAALKNPGREILVGGEVAGYKRKGFFTGVPVYKNVYGVVVNKDGVTEIKKVADGEVTGKDRRFLFHIALVLLGIIFMAAGVVATYRKKADYSFFLTAGAFVMMASAFLMLFIATAAGMAIFIATMSGLVTLASSLGSFESRVLLQQGSTEKKFTASLRRYFSRAHRSRLSCSVSGSAPRVHPRSRGFCYVCAGEGKGAPCAKHAAPFRNFFDIFDSAGIVTQRYRDYAKRYRA